ncbi:hypothetical protein BH23BAC1_BH23BAC1_31410 [soil metagenome]
MTSEISDKKFKLKSMAPLLQVYDMPTSIHFYRDILGFEVVSSSGEGDEVNWVLFIHNDVEIMLNTMFEKPTRPSTRDLNRQSVHQDVILYFGCSDINYDAYNYLTSKGINLNKPEITRYGLEGIKLNRPRRIPSLLSLSFT